MQQPAHIEYSLPLQQQQALLTRTLLQANRMHHQLPRLEMLKLMTCKTIADALTLLLRQAVAAADDS